ncbi:hypothetical protein E3A20_12970, partial [Planctomyces bekefii]
QLALMIERKSGADLTSSFGEGRRRAGLVNATYQSASYTLEPVSWLRMLQHGRLRTQRETSWYLGLNFGPDHYVLAYCLLTGPDGVRERLGTMIWHHLYVMRAQSFSAGHQRVELNELRDEFQGFFAAIPKAQQLENIVLAFTVFSREDKKAYSGHFGPSRPFVIGVENYVSPSNDVVLTYANGRDLRYWDVTADLNGPHCYILSYDTSKLDAAPIDTVQRRIAQSLAEAERVEDLHRILGSMVRESSLPRYYVSAILNTQVEEGESEPDLPDLPKAQ